MPQTSPPPVRPPAVDPPGLIVPEGLRAQYVGHPEYARQWGLVSVRAAAAYARIADRDGQDVLPGSGVKVALLDTGIDQGHWSFAQQRVAETLLGAEEEIGIHFSHGTAVAGIIASLRDAPVPQSLQAESVSFHGVAWGAELRMYGIPLGSSNPNRPYAPIEPMIFSSIDQNQARIYDTVLSGKPDILNMSFGFSGLIHNYNEELLRSVFAHTIEQLAQSNRPASEDRTLLVVSGGNANGRACVAGTSDCVGNHNDFLQNRLDASSAEVLSGLPAQIEELRGHYVAVVAIGRDGELASFSNRCGIAAKWCIAAPGVDVSVLLFGDLSRGYTRSSGTSMSAPFVSGGLALLKQWFRGQLTNPQLLTRLYETADVTPDEVDVGQACPAHLDTDGDLSACELSSTHGRGTMNLEAASAPVGMVTVGGAQAGAGTVARASYLHPGPALGDALTRSFAGRETAVFDSLGAPFWVDLGAFTTPAASTALDRRLLSALDGVAGTARPEPAPPGAAAFAPPPYAERRPGLHAARLPVGGGVSHLGLAAGGLRLDYAGGGPLTTSAFAASGSTGSVYGLGLSWAPGSAAGRLGIGWLHESGALLQSESGGAFGRLSADTVYAGIGGDWEADRWRFTLGAELGAVLPRAGAGLITEWSTLWTSAFMLAAEHTHPTRGRLRLSLSQPLRVEHGTAGVQVPVGRTPGGRVLYEPASARLSPSGRQVDLALSWERALTYGNLHLEGVYSRRPGHSHTAPDLGFLAAWRLRF